MLGNADIGVLHCVLGVLIRYRIALIRGCSRLLSAHSPFTPHLKNSPLTPFFFLPTSLLGWVGGEASGKF